LRIAGQKNGNCGKASEDLLKDFYIFEIKKHLRLGGDMWGKKEQLVEGSREGLGESSPGYRAPTNSLKKSLVGDKGGGINVTRAFALQILIQR